MGEVAVSAHFLLKICFKVSPARLPQGTPQLPRLCRENESDALRGGEGNGEQEAWSGPGREAPRERGLVVPECRADPAEFWALRGPPCDREGSEETDRITGGKHFWVEPGERTESLRSQDPDTQVLSFSR